jgi:hypothetical protein
MSPRRRQLVLHALFDIRGAFPVDMGQLLGYSNAERLKLFTTIAKTFDGAQATDLLPPPG